MLPKCQVPCRVSHNKVRGLSIDFSTASLSVFNQRLINLKAVKIKPERFTDLYSNFQVYMFQIKLTQISMLLYLVLRLCAHCQAVYYFRDEATLHSPDLCLETPLMPYYSMHNIILYIILYYIISHTISYIIYILSHYLFHHAFQIVSKMLLNSVLPLCGMSLSARHVFLIYFFFTF